MTNLTITHEQHQKLTEMCKVLFPIDYKNRKGENITIFKKGCPHCLQEWVLTEVELGNDENSKTYYVTDDIGNNKPIFEFLLTDFQYKLYVIYDSHICGTGADYFEDMITTQSFNATLIDYMYEQFKEIDDKTWKFYNLK